MFRKVSGIGITILFALLLMQNGISYSTAQTPPPTTPPAASTPEAGSTLEVNTITGSVAKPDLVKFDESYLKQLQLPKGFEVSLFAKDVGNPRVIAVANDGTVYVTRPETNDVVAFSDTGVNAGPMRVVASNLNGVHGITIHNNRVYLAGIKQVWVADFNADGTLSAPQTLINDLPDSGQHARRTIAFGPDGMMYIALGSSCNACLETNQENATIVQANPDGTARKVFAKGLRNTLAWGWQPDTKQMWGMDHGVDWAGDDQPPEELNSLQENANYGWPFCYGDKQVNKYIPYVAKGMTNEQYCATTMGATLDYQAHSAPIALVFYTGSQFPAQYQGSAFVTMHGSWNRAEPTGYKVVWLKFADGKPQGFDDFMTGFLVNNNAGVFGRPAGIAIAKDGSLLVGDDTNGVIYRISYKGV